MCLLQNHTKINLHLGECILELKAQRSQIYNQPKTERENDWVVSAFTFDLPCLTHLKERQLVTTREWSCRGADRQHLEMNGATELHWLSHEGLHI